MYSELVGFLKSQILIAIYNDYSLVGDTSLEMYKLVRRQIRAIFTTICLLFDIRVDTSACDKLLNEVYDYCKLEEVNISFDQFEELLIQDLV